MPTRAELLDHAVDLINPAPDRRDQCRQQIVYHASIGGQLIANRKEPLAGQLREEIAAYELAAKKFLVATKGLSRRASANLFNDLSGISRDDLVSALEAVNTHADVLAHQRGIKVRATGPQPDVVMVAAANWALRILSEFTDRDPTTTIGGPYYELTGVLFEFVTGKSPGSVERVCKNELKAFKRMKAEQAKLELRRQEGRTDGQAPKLTIVRP